MRFTKMHGCGNDYIYFNCMEGVPAGLPALSIRLSDRHFGIGGDGIVLICKSETADAKMRMFNADGSEGKMCGNAIRCVGKYLYDNGICRKESLDIDTLSGIKHITLEIENGVAVGASVNMGKPELQPEKIPVLCDGNSVIDCETAIANDRYNITCVSMGNPHCVVFCEEVKNIDLEKIGPKFENASIFPERVNTEFVRIIDENTIEMRVWERGSGETLACGTGACASVVAACLCGYCKKGTPVKVILRGGELTVTYTDGGVIMQGPATKVFDGEVD